MSLTAVYDACILYPAPLRDFLMWLALTNLFKAKWTEEIHAEWMRNVLKNRPDLTLEQLTRTKNLMNANVQDCLVTGYESLITTINLPDPGDRHVLSNQAELITQCHCESLTSQDEDPFSLLQNDMISANAAYFFGERLLGMKFIIASSTCDLVENRSN